MCFERNVGGGGNPQPTGISDFRRNKKFWSGNESNQKGSNSQTMLRFTFRRAVSDRKTVQNKVKIFQFRKSPKGSVLRKIGLLNERFSSFSKKSLGWKPQPTML